MRIVLDTNVLISGLLTPYGAPGRIVSLVAAGDLTLCFDGRILGEYREVLARPKFPFQTGQIDALLEQIQHQGEPISPRPLPEPLLDRDDEPFLEAAIAGNVACLVTGNQRHYPNRCRQRIRVATPAIFLDEIWNEGT